MLMKNLKLILSILVFAIGVFSFVNAQSICTEIAPGLYSCEIWQECPSGAAACACPAPYWDVGSWEMCWDPCELMSWMTNLYQCDDYQYCPDGGICNCPSVGTISPYDACYPWSNPSACTYSGETIYPWMTMQLYKTTTWACEQESIVCDSNWSTGLSDLNSSGYIYTWCVPSALTLSGCDLWWNTYPHWGSATGYSVPSGSCILNSIQCNDWVWSNDTWLVQYDVCSSTPTGWSSPSWWGGSYTPTCDLEDLVCVDGEYQEKDGVSCRDGELWESCTIITWENNTEINIDSFDRIWDISNSSYSAELNLAYLYAYNMWITTMDNIFDANMEWNLIRSHMAKMLVEWAKNVMWLEINTGITCDFDDIDSLQGQDLYDFVIQSCQMWLMWLDDQGNPANNFYPGDVVTRAQFGTVLSRAIWGDYYNGWNPYYEDHLDALNVIEIMNNISDPWMLELRWYVMLMLFRADNLLNY